MTNINSAIAGVFPVLPTIFNQDGAIDFQGFGRVIDYVVKSGVDGVVFPGLASEASDLSREERLMLIEHVGKRLDGRARFIVGASAEDVADSIAYARAGVEAGACAAMIMTPRSSEGDLDALKQFYEDVGRAASIPIMLQNAPSPMGLGLDVDTIARLVSGVKEIAYIKEETSPCGQRITQLAEALGDSIIGILGGAGGRYILDELNRGALGTLPACEISEVHVEMYKAYRAGKVDMAYDLYERSLPLLVMQAVFRWRLTKELLSRRGLINCAFTRTKGPEFDLIDQRELSTLIERMGLKL